MAFNQFTDNFLNSLYGSTYGNKREIVSVNGLIEAQSYYLNKGENIILRDRNEDIIYVKACDELGKYSLKVYQCNDVTERYLLENQPATVSRSDLDSIRSEIAGLAKMVKGVMDEHNAKQPATGAVNDGKVQKVQ